MRFLFLPLLAMTLTAAPPSKIFPYAYDQYDLPNGLRLITIPTDFPNIVSLYTVVSVGSRHEVEPGKTGFAHFFEHCMFRGTKKYPPQKWEAVMKAAGAATNAYTSDDLTVYHATFAKEGLESILELEADRFQNLEYSESAFRTEALAVNGEYNKNSSEPVNQLQEKLRETAFQQHTYRHTTMGFLADIKAMPNQYEYSKQFFSRFYRPENVTVLVVGDVDQKQVRAMVEKYWGSWKKGADQPKIPVEPPQTEERKAHVEWPTATPSWMMIGYRVPSFTENMRDSAALDLISSLAMGQTSPLYQRLVIEEQKNDVLGGGYENHADPYLFLVYSRTKKDADVPAVREAIISTLNGYKDTLVDAKRLEDVKQNLRYRFALSLDNSEAIAAGLSPYLALTRTPETLNQIYDIYASLTPEDLREVARKYFVASGRTVVTLSQKKEAK
jgi:zinc protease